MFQYLQDLKEHDEGLMSNFLPHSVDLSPCLRIEFLINWDKNLNLICGNTEDWKLEGDNIGENQFIQNFLDKYSSKEDKETVFCESRLPTSMEVSLISTPELWPRIFFQSISYYEIMKVNPILGGRK